MLCISMSRRGGALERIVVDVQARLMGNMIVIYFGSWCWLFVPDLLVCCSFFFFVPNVFFARCLFFFVCSRACCCAYPFFLLFKSFLLRVPFFFLLAQKLVVAGSPFFCV